MAKNNSKKLLSNVGVFTVTLILPKILSFFLLPLYTSCLSTEEYGISDLILNTNAMLLPIFSISINNAVMLFTIENKSDLRPLRIGWCHFKLSSVALASALVITGLLINVRWDYLLFIWAIYVSNVFSDILMAYLRAQEKMRVVGFCSVTNSFLTIVCNIITISILHLGVYGFLISTIIGYTFQGIVILFYYRKNGLLYYGVEKNSYELRARMYKYSFPLVLSGLTWWVYSVSDRYFITGMINASENGVYSVAYKIPNLLQMIQNVFSHAWFFSAIDLYNSKEGRQYAESVYDVYHFVMTLGCSVFIAGDILLARFLFAKDFFAAWKFVPPLMISIVFTALSTFLGTFCIVNKRSDISAKISISTVVVNIGLNYVLIHWLDSAMGAAIATAVTAGITWIIQVIMCSKKWDVHIPYIRHITSFLLLVVQSIILVRMQNYYWEIFIVLLVILTNIRPMEVLLKKGKEYILSEKNNILKK